MTNLEKVREALDKVGLFDREDRNAMDAALSALQAHEEEVRLLLQAARDIAEHNMTYFGEDAATSDPASLWSKVRFLRSALRPFTGDEK